jgi:hypothetical protein
VSLGSFARHTDIKDWRQDAALTGRQDVRLCGVAPLPHFGAAVSHEDHFYFASGASPFFALSISAAFSFAVSSRVRT